MRKQKIQQMDGYIQEGDDLRVSKGQKRFVVGLFVVLIALFVLVLNESLTAKTPTLIPNESQSPTNGSDTLDIPDIAIDVPDIKEEPAEESTVTSGTTVPSIPEISVTVPEEPKEEDTRISVTVDVEGNTLPSKDTMGQGTQIAK